MRASGNLRPLLYVEETVTNYKAEVNAAFVSVFNSKTSYPQSIPSLKWKG